MLLEKLRAHCHDDHEALHVHPLLAPLEQSLSIAQYKPIIAMFHAVYSATEQEKPGTDFPDAPVLNWLHEDMRTHHIAPANWTSPQIPLVNESALIGYLYVKQGSTLGGQYISKQLQANLGLEPGVTNRFFHGYGTETGAMWRHFKQLLAQAESRLDHGQVLTAAKQSFETIRKSADHMLCSVHDSKKAAH